MCNRRSQFDMAHTLTAHTLQRDFNAAFLADNAAILHALVFAAQAFVVLDRTKNTRTEETITFRLECPVVDRLGLANLTIGP